MSARDLVARCRAAGMSLAVTGENLTVECTRPPPAELVEELRRRKVEVIAYALETHSTVGLGEDAGHCGAYVPGTIGYRICGAPLPAGQDRCPDHMLPGWAVQVAGSA